MNIDELLKAEAGQELDQEIAFLKGWKITEIDTPVVYEGDEPRVGHYRIVCPYRLVNDKGEFETSAWQTHDLVLEHAEFPEFSASVDVALTLIPVGVSFELTHDYLTSERPSVMCWFASIWPFSTNQGKSPTPALAICRAWLQWRNTRTNEE